MKYLKTILLTQVALAALAAGLATAFTDMAAAEQQKSRMHCVSKPTAACDPEGRVWR